MPLTLALLALASPPCPTDPGAALGGLGLTGAFGSAVGASWAQPTAPDVGSGLYASPPPQSQLDRLRLAQEWYAYVPLTGRNDGIALVQVIDADLVVAQTRSGLVVALDGRTGARQWAYQLPSAFATAYPVAVTGRFLFVGNLATAVSLNRITGQVEFVQSLTGSVTTGPAAAQVPVYGIRENQKAVVGQRAELYLTLNGNRLADFPVPEAGRVVLAALPPPTLPVFLPVRQPPPDTGGVDTGRNRTPSITSLPVVVPPYSLYGRQLRTTPSLTVLPAVHDQTTRNPEYLRNNQRTPSISVLPPSVARAFELTNLRARAPELAPAWVFGSSRRLEFEPVLSPAVPGVAGARVFATTAGRHVTVVNAEDGRRLFEFDFEAPLAAPAAGPAAVGDAAIGVFALDYGAVVALDLARGTEAGPAVVWRTVVGGRLDRKPVLTTDSVYVAGETAGVTRLDLRTGDIVWRTDPGVNRLLAVGDEFVFARDRAGNTQVLPKNARPAADGRIRPVATLPAAGYTVPVTNSQTDRLVLAADNGLVVSLRDAVPGAIRPRSIAPPTTPAPPAANPPVVNPDTPPLADPKPANPPVPPAAKKDEPPAKKDVPPTPKKDGE